MIALLLGLLSAGHAAVTRFALVLGNNEGAPDTRPLYFAEYDAEKMYRILTDVGGVDPERATLLLGASRNRLLREMGELRMAIQMAEANGDDTMLIFYYSGHADEERLELGRSWLTWEELDQFLRYSGADVRMAFLDACRSGAMTRAKGATRAPSFIFELSERLDAEGQVIVTSSARDEASQESDEIGGGYFTHFLASALSGAADADADGKVTLTEAYRYVYDETVYQTRESAHGTQHPTFEWDLAGEGDIVLADLDRGRATLVFTPDFQGRYAIFDRDRREFVAELDLDGTREHRVSLRPGTYLVQERFPTHLLVAQVRLADGETADLDGASFAAVEYEHDIAKGAIQRRIRRAKQPDLSIHVGAGTRRFSDPEVEASYFPTVVAGSIGARWNFHDHKWVSGDLVSGAGAGAIQVEGLSWDIPVVVTGTTLGVGFGYATAPRLFQVGGGIRMAGVYTTRAFPGQDIPTQALLSVAPGLEAWVGLHPGNLAFEFDLRSHYLPYLVDDRDVGFGFSEGLLTFGYRF